MPASSTWPSSATGTRTGGRWCSSTGSPTTSGAYDRVAATLAGAGADVVVPYLRGYGATRFISGDTMRSGQQGALAHDLLELIDALGLAAPIVAGYDWGGRAACLVAMLWPERVSGLVSVSGYNVQNIPASGQPAPPEDERRLWYQYYLHNERGRAGLAAYREDYTRLLWREWSPNWKFTDGRVRRHRAVLQQPRLRRCRGPLLPAPLRPGRRRPRL